MQVCTRWHSLVGSLSGGHLGAVWLGPSNVLSTLSKRLQGRQEPVRDYAEALRTLARYSTQSNIEGFSLHFFLQGLEHDGLRRFVLSRHPEVCWY